MSETTETFGLKVLILNTNKMFHEFSKMNSRSDGFVQRFALVTFESVRRKMKNFY